MDDFFSSKYTWRVLRWFWYSVLRGIVLFCCERNRRVVPVQHVYDENDDEKVLLGIMVVLYQRLVGNEFSPIKHCVSVSTNSFRTN